MTGADPLAVLAARERPGTYWLAAQPLLLDTHALLWWLLDDPQLSAAAREAISDARRRVCVSAASAGGRRLSTHCTGRGMRWASR